MTKKEIIEIIKRDIEPKTDEEKKIFGTEGRDNIGNNQFRRLAALCRSASCYDEIELLVKYKEAKDVDELNTGSGRYDTKNSHWAKVYKNGKTLAEVIIDAMTLISESCGDKDDCLDDLSLFFGYLYWSARIWSNENKENSAAVYGRSSKFSGGGRR